MQRKVNRGAVTAVAAMIATALALGACGGDDDGGSNSAAGGGAGGSKASIPIGQVGAYSGPVPGLAGQGKGLEAWVKTVNGKGGINGHKVELHVSDSKGDPTAEVSEVTQFATQKKVVALAGMGLATVAGVAKFLDQQKIPVIGGNTNDIAWTTNSGFYTPGAGLMGTYLGGFFALPEGKTKTGIVYCKESPACETVYNLMFKQGFSKVNGGTPVYRAEASLAAPSFTAQCLAAKQAGVEVLAVAFDTANLIRLAKDCNKQGFKPTYTTGGTVAGDTMAKSGVTEGGLSGQAQAPWFLEDGPIAEHRAAMEKYFPDFPADSTTVSGWTAGVALGKAIENAYKANPEADELTAEDIRKGLGMIKDETFGGLTAPVTWTESGIQKQSNCYFGIVVKNGKWEQQGSEPTCPGPEAQPVIDKAVKALTTK